MAQIVTDDADIPGDLRKLKMQEIAKRISVHLHRFEADPKINVPGGANKSLRPFYNAGAVDGGSRVRIWTVSYQGAYTLKKSQALRYLIWLDTGGIGSVNVYRRDYAKVTGEDMHFGYSR